MTHQLYKLYDDLQQDGVDINERTASIEIQIAYALAARLTIPAEAVEDKDEYFRTNHMPTVNRVISEFSNTFPLSPQEVATLVRIFWCLRYCLVHDTNPKTIHQLVCALAEGEGRYVKLSHDLPPRYREELQHLRAHSLHRVTDTLDTLLGKGDSGDE